jgi:hypothetical protein
MRFTLLAFCCLALAAQQAKEKIEYCGLGSHHECDCLRRTQAVRQKFIENCERSSMRSDGSKDDKVFDKCMTRMPAHCDIADHVSIWNSDRGEWESDPVMSEHCTMACKKHDCTCDDGPTCHFGHQASEHDQRSQVFPPH